MKLWSALYLLIWVSLVEFLLVMTPTFNIYLSYAHIILGVIIIGLAYYNFRGLRGTAVPGRVKRIARTTIAMAVLAAITGVLLYFRIGGGWGVLGITVGDAILFIHYLAAFAIITQAAAVAIAYDMWEDKEFAKESEPGKVPPMHAK